MKTYTTIGLDVEKLVREYGVELRTNCGTRKLLYDTTYCILKAKSSTSTFKQIYETDSFEEAISVFKTGICLREG